MTEFITLEKFIAAGGMQLKEIPDPAPVNVPRCQELGTWPEEMPVPDNIYYVSNRVYERTARELAKEFNTTVRQISKLRNGKIKEAKPLDWYEENRKIASNSKRTGSRKRGFTPTHLPTGV